MIYGVAFVVDGAAASTTGSFLVDLCGVFFQLGVFCLLAAMWRTQATGTTRLARSMIVVESVVLGVATVQSLLTLPAMGGEWSTAATLLDPFWPLSMLGMAILGVKVAVAGRWRGALRPGPSSPRPGSSWPSPRWRSSAPRPARSSPAGTSSSATASGCWPCAPT